MKKAGPVLIIGLFLLAYTYVFAQEEAGIVTVPNRGLIKGKVTDTQTPRPNNIGGATVTVQSELLLEKPISATTDSAGNYEIPNLPVGEYVVTTSKPGYDDSMEYVTVTPGGEAFHDVRLYKTDTLISFLSKSVTLRWLGIICLVVVVTIIYIIVRRSSSETQNR